MCADMVQAILEGRKTQTRRLLKVQPVFRGGVWQWDPTNSDHSIWKADENPNEGDFGPWRKSMCPYGIVGDRLYVKETWKPHADVDEEGAVTEEHPLGTCVKYKADGAMIKPSLWNEEQGFWCESQEDTTHWRPSIFMPRWASRITLEITEVRVQRAKEISEEDAIAEGIVWGRAGSGISCFQIKGEDWGNDTAVGRYANLWDSINGSGSWEKNPWVFAITFTKL